MDDEELKGVLSQENSLHTDSETKMTKSDEDKQRYDSLRESGHVLIFKRETFHGIL